MERVYYAGIESPMGIIWAAATERGLLQVSLPRESGFLESIKGRIDAQVVNDLERLLPLSGMMESYFRGERVDFDLPLDLRGTEFQKAVWRATYAIPYGRLSSYGRLAVAVGRPRAARAVGNAVGSNPLAIVIPCHRVVRSDGGLGGFGGRPELKRYLLGVEGVLPQVEGPIRKEHLRQFFE